MYAKPFNPNLPYGQCFGDSRYAFEQGGQTYNAMRQPVDGNGNVMETAPAQARPAAKNGDHTLDDPELPPSAAGINENPAHNGRDDDDTPEDEKPFDLFGWATGNEALQATAWFRIRAEVARVIDDPSAITSKEAARKAVLKLYKMI